MNNSEMSKGIIFATSNKNKMVEVRKILEELGMQVLSMEEAGIHINIEENGKTFEENALIKAKSIYEMENNSIILADDSGLEIDYLNKEPGIYSARYAGENTSYEVKNQLLLDRLKGVKPDQRTARFVCAIAAVFPDGSSEMVKGVVEGQIGMECKGENGFGYDPIFYIPELHKTTAELSLEEKNKVSHRGRALEIVKELIKCRM